ncbi:ABC transporter permease [Tenggerimyces flavus]|uniref:FtsX-like permease family protein n=1 Tax=Tenggerimyces flavus TaxID=1708749 RepID=A0ABV7YIB6_9ACTN|nr:FtsX-like permease family protein [Tenggerimyces flavus]MBM7787648.1 hypothetical protein [Tenggerimyces flavus]
MSLLLLWLRIDLRQHWRSLVVLGLLVAIAAGIVLASVAGALRGSTALDRLLAQTLPATAIVRPSGPVEVERIRALPQVAASSTFNGYTGFGIDEVPGQTVGLYVPADSDAMRTIERPAVLAGRLADPTMADEAVVTERFVQTHGLGVGDSVTLRLFLQEEVTTGVSGVRSVTPPRPGGPTVPVRIVGVVRSTWFGDSVDSTGQLTPSVGVFQRYRENFVDKDESEVVWNLIVRLHGGEAAIPDFRRALDQLELKTPYELDDRAAELAHIREVVRFESSWLVVFGLCALLVGGALVGQAVVRTTQRAVLELEPLRAVGLQRTQLVALAGVVPALVAVAGAVLGAAAAVAVSGWFPFGTAADYEPSPGLHADALVLAVGLLLVPLLVYAGAALAGILLLYRPLPARRLRSSTLARAAARAGLAVPVVIGVRLALEPERIRGTILRPAIGGAMVGVLGVVAATLFAVGVADAAERPERFGQRYQAMLGFGHTGKDLADPVALIDIVEKDPDVLRVVDARFAVAGAGSSTVITFGMPVEEHGALVVDRGVPPGATYEVLLAPKAAERFGADVGSTVPLDGDKGTKELLVTGIGFVPETEYNGYSDGAVVTPDGYKALFTGFVNHVAFLSLRPGGDLQAVSDRMYAAAKGKTDTRQAYVTPMPPPQQLAEIRNVRLLPIGLGLFLGLFAVSAVAHALTKAVRHRRRELGVLRAVGMTPWQTRSVVVTQASVLAVVGVLVGVPLGIVLGRTVWRMVAQLMPLAYVPPTALWVVLLSVPVALLVATLLAALPGARAARLPLGQILRAE